MFAIYLLLGSNKCLFGMKLQVPKVGSRTRQGQLYII